MRTIIVLAVTSALLFSCNKKLENTSQLSGIWEIESTVITNYADNKETGDSVVEQSGILLMEATGGLDNDCSTDLALAPCLPVCHWDIPKGKADQVFFYFHDENSFSIYASSCMVEKHNNRKLTLMRVSYDNDLNILQRVRWKFRKGKL